MSQSNPGQSQPNTPQASSQALLDELRHAADRARDERLKLARLVKHSSELPISKPTGGGDASQTPDARFVALSQQVEQLEQAVSEKLGTLEQVQEDIESRSQYLESLRHTITDTTRAFVTQVEQAQHFKAHVDAAKQHVKMSAGRVVEDIRQHLSEYEEPIAKRIAQLNEMDEQIDKRIARMQQMHKQASEAVDQHLLAALRTAKEQAADFAQPVKEEVDKHLQEQSKKVEEAIHAKIAALDVDVEEALSPLTNRFDEIVADAQAKADNLAEALPGRVDGMISEQLDTLRERLAKQADEVIKGLDEETIDQAGQRIRERIAKSLDGYLAEADQHAGGYVDGLITKLDEAREQSLARFLDSVQEIEADCSMDREQMTLRLNDEVARLTELANERMEHAQGVVEGATDGLHAKVNSAVESAMRVADEKIKQYESDSVEQLRLIDQGIEHGMEQARQRLIDFDRKAREQGHEAMNIADNALANAQERLAKFEAGVAQRIANATQTVDESVRSIDERMLSVEHDASARVMKIVDLAEESGRTVAESIATLAKSAQTTADKAQADLEEKLDAFEKISAESLKTAEQTLRANISELRDTSRAMIEVVTRQVKAQAAEIEPQTAEVIREAEQTMRRRLGELRDGAQSMVELTVSRLESQLNDVKTKAQHAAFKGIKPSDAA